MRVTSADAARKRGRMRGLKRSAAAWKPLTGTEPSFHVADPDGEGWWDLDLTLEESRRRIDGLARSLEEDRRKEAHPGFIEAELAVLVGLRRRLKQEEAQAEAEGDARDRDEYLERMRDPAQRAPEIWRLHEEGLAQRPIAVRVGCAQATVNRTLQAERRRRGIE